MVQTGIEDYRISSLKIRFAEIRERIKNLRVCLTGIEISPAIVQELRASREALHRLFSQPSYQKLCSNCHDGYCCMNDYGQYLLPHELIYFAAIGYNLLTPDWEFLEKEAYWAKPQCMFLSPGGCLLKENRRIICLRYYCRGLFRKLKEEKQNDQFVVLRRKLETATIVFTQEVIGKLGSKLDATTLCFLQYFLHIHKAA